MAGGLRKTAHLLWFLVLFIVHENANNADICTPMTKSVTVVQLPAAEITLKCSYNVDPGELHHIRWDYGQKDSHHILTKHSGGPIIYGEAFTGKMRLGEGCSLVITNVTADLAGTYVVRVTSRLACISATELNVLTENSYIYAHGVTLSALSTLSVKLPTKEIVLPCNYTLGTKHDFVTIEWRYGEPEESFVVRSREGNVQYGSQFQGRFGLGDGCSLVISKPQQNDSGTYSVQVSINLIDGLREKSQIHLEVEKINQKENELPTETEIGCGAVIVLGIVTTGIVLGILLSFGVYFLYTRIKYKRASSDDGEEENFPLRGNIDKMSCFIPEERRSNCPSSTGTVSGVKKKCTASGRKKGLGILLKWTKSITNHLWYACSACGGDAMELKRIWHSILYHATGVHRWEDENGTTHSCHHQPLSEEDQERRMWIDPMSTAFRDLTSIVMDPRLNKDLEQLTLFKHTSGLESYHSTMLKFASKRLHFHYPAMNGRMQLAVIDHNYNTGRKAATTQEGKTKYRFVSSKQKGGEWTAKTVAEEKSHGYALEMVGQVLARREDPSVAYMSRESFVELPKLPKNIAKEPRPPVEELIAKKMKH